MARSARRKTAPGAAVTTTVAAPWQRNRKVVNLTKAIRALDKKTAKMFVDAVVKIGRMLADAREELPHGEWLAWLDNGVFYAHRTASRYIAVAQWAHTRPREFARITDLSITKIYRLLRLDPELRRRLVGRRHLVPSTNRRQPLADMTTVQLDEVIDSFAAVAPVDDPLPHLVQATRQRFAGLEASLDELLAHDDRLDRNVLTELHTAAVHLADRLAAALPRRRP